LFSLWTSNVKGQIERKFSKSKNLPNFDLLRGLEIRGYEKLRFLLQKAHPCVNTRRLSYFAWRSVGGGGGLTPEPRGKKSEILGLP